MYVCYTRENYNYDSGSMFKRNQMQLCWVLSLGILMFIVTWFGISFTPHHASIAEWIDSLEGR